MKIEEMGAKIDEVWQAIEANEKNALFEMKPKGYCVKCKSALEREE